MKLFWKFVLGIFIRSKLLFLNPMLTYLYSKLDIMYSLYFASFHFLFHLYISLTQFVQPSHRCETPPYHTLTISYEYIYIYIVCVCVCVCEYMHEKLLCFSSEASFRLQHPHPKRGREVSERGVPRGVVANELSCNIVINEFEPHHALMFTFGLTIL